MKKAIYHCHIQWWPIWCHSPTLQRTIEIIGPFNYLFRGLHFYQSTPPIKNYVKRLSLRIRHQKKLMSINFWLKYSRWNQLIIIGCSYLTMVIFVEPLFRKFSIYLTRLRWWPTFTNVKIIRETPPDQTLRSTQHIRGVRDEGSGSPQMGHLSADSWPELIIGWSGLSIWCNNGFFY